MNKSAPRGADPALGSARQGHSQMREEAHMRWMPRLIETELKQAAADFPVFIVAVRRH